MFGDPAKNEKGWKVKTIRDLAREVKYGTSSPAAEDGSYPYLRMNNITYSGELDLTNLKYINVAEKDLEKYGTQKGDLLFNRTNSKELVGKTTVIDNDTPMVLAGYLIRVRFTEEAEPNFVSSFLNTSQGKSVLQNMCKSIIGMANINAQELQDISIIVPPKNIQEEYVRRISLVKEQKRKMMQTYTTSNSLFHQTLQMKFTN